MNATRAATIRLRSSFDGAVSLGRVQTPTLALIARREEEIRAFKPEAYWLVDALFEPTGGEPGRRYAGRYHAGAQPRLKTAAEAEAIVAAVRGRDGEITKLEKTTQEGARAAPVRPHHAPARGEQPLRLLRPAHARGRAAALRGAQGAHLPAHELPLPDRRHGRRDQADRRARRQAARVRPRRGVRDRAGHAPARPRGQRRQGHRPPRDHPDEGRAPDREDVRRRQARLRHGRAPLPRRLPSRGRVREHAPGDHGRRARVPHPRPGAGRAGLARRLRRGLRGPRRRQDDDEGADQSLPEGRAGRGRRGRSRSPPRRRRPSRRGATPTRRCSPRWRPPASSSTTTSCARR